jgi:hypothetical protein
VEPSGFLFQQRPNSWTTKLYVHGCEVWWMFHFTKCSSHCYYTSYNVPSRYVAWFEVVLYHMYSNIACTLLLVLYSIPLGLCTQWASHNLLIPIILLLTPIHNLISLLLPSWESMKNPMGIHEQVILLIGFRAHKLRPTRVSSSYTFALICMVGLD